MNTPMQQLKEKLQVTVDRLEGAVHGTDQYGYRGAMENVIKDIDAQMLAIEAEYIKASTPEPMYSREQILDIISPLELNENYDAGYHYGAGMIKDMIIKKLDASLSTPKKDAQGAVEQQNNPKG